MPEITRRHFKTWEGLTSFLDRTFSYYNQFIFRGQADANWKLESSLTRALKRLPNRSNKLAKAVVKNHLVSFKDNICGRCAVNFKTVSEDELWALGQHFGLATPLLDWTISPYVALFFALEQQLESKKRCIWALSKSAIEEHNSKKARIKLSMIKPLSNENPRLISQQGLFLKIPFDKSVEEIIEMSRRKEVGASIYKLTFDSKIRYEALSALNNMNINKLTLYPDLIGAALHSNYKLEVEPHLQTGRAAMWMKYGNKMLKNIGPINVRKINTGWEASIKKPPIVFKVKNESEIAEKLKQKLNQYLQKGNTGISVAGNFELGKKQSVASKKV